jgi:hypothetical protein
MRAMTSIVVFQTSGKIASETGVMPAGITFADEDIHVEEALHGGPAKP